MIPLSRFQCSSRDLRSLAVISAILSPGSLSAWERSLSFVGCAYVLIKFTYKFFHIFAVLPQLSLDLLYTREILVSCPHTQNM